MQGAEGSQDRSWRIRRVKGRIQMDEEASVVSVSTDAAARCAGLSYGESRWQRKRSAPELATLRLAKRIA
jgi:hypothetical protein